MNKNIVATAIAVALTFGSSQMDAAASGRGGAGGGAARGSVPPRSAAPRPPAPRTSTARGPGSAAPVGTATPPSGGRRPLIPQPGARPVWPYYGAYGGALGLGLYGYYDPLWYGPDAYSSPYGYPDMYAEPSYGYPPPDVPAAAVETGSLRFDVHPKSANIVIDGYFAGIVDDFDGHFQHLDLVSGPHHVELRAPGYAPLEFDVNIQPHRTIRYHGTLTKT